MQSKHNKDHFLFLLSRSLVRVLAQPPLLIIMLIVISISYHSHRDVSFLFSYCTTRQACQGAHSSAMDFSLSSQTRREVRLFR
jgi:hypothetical protein